MDEFMLSRQASRCRPRTLEHYVYTVGSFVDWLEQGGVDCVNEIDPHRIRAYLIALQARGLKDTTQHAHARGIKAWLNWLVAEGDLQTSAMGNVSMPRLSNDPLPPYSIEDVRKLLRQCDRTTAIGARNRAAILCLLDTGLRASEFIALTVGDVDMRTGLISVLGKGEKRRQTRVGTEARRAIVRMSGFWLDVDSDMPLWGAHSREGFERRPLSLGGLRSVLKRTGDRSGVSPCTPHRFRRTFALWCVRAGMDLNSLRMLMGHSSLAVLQRYLALAGEDIERAHAAHSPVDNVLSA